VPRAAGVNVHIRNAMPDAADSSAQIAARTFCARIRSYVILRVQKPDSLHSRLGESRSENSDMQNLVQRYCTYGLLHHRNRAKATQQRNNPRFIVQPRFHGSEVPILLLGARSAISVMSSSCVGRQHRCSVRADHSQGHDHSVKIFLSHFIRLR
jgi:hypothetical protein